MPDAKSHSCVLEGYLLNVFSIVPNDLALLILLQRRPYAVA